MKIIKLGRKGLYDCKVSDEDYEALTRWRWNYKFSSWAHKKGIYARRGGGRRASGTVQPTVLMHVYILETLMGVPRPSPEHTPDHKDRDTLNNQRGNLRWATKSEQRQNQTPRKVHAPPLVPSKPRPFAETFGETQRDPLSEEIAA